jgi:hypothetical protein
VSYKQLGSPLVCAEFDADNFDRVTAKVQDWVASQSTKRNAKYDEPFTKKEMERAVADLPTYKAGAADLKSELIKAGGSALVKPPEASELGMELETLRGRKGDR